MFAPPADARRARRAAHQRRAPRAAALASTALLVVTAGCGTKQTTLTGPVVKEGLECVPEVKRNAEAPAVPTDAKVGKKIAKTDDVKGKGCTASAKTGSYYSLDLVGATAADAKVFTSSWKTGHPLTVRLGQNQLIPGLESGLDGMKVGGRRTITVPAAQAYGKAGNPAQGIGPNQDLVFVADLIAATDEPEYCASAAIKPGDDGKAVPGKPTEVDMPVQAPTKVVTEDLKEGTGKAAAKGNSVTLNYLGLSCPTGVEFDTSWGKEPLPFTVGEGTIEGFGDGVTGMKKGGRRRVEIPWEQAYGAAGQPPTIGPKEPLVFVIDVLDIADKPPASTTAPAPEASSVPSGSVPGDSTTATSGEVTTTTAAPSTSGG